MQDKPKLERYILGYSEPQSEDLTVFDNMEDAMFNSEEWCIVYAPTLEEAKGRYEEAFENWRKTLNI